LTKNVGVTIVLPLATLYPIPASVSDLNDSVLNNLLKA